MMLKAYFDPLKHAINSGDSCEQMIVTLEVPRCSHDIPFKY